MNLDKLKAFTGIKPQWFIPRMKDTKEVFADPLFSDENSSYIIAALVKACVIFDDADGAFCGGAKGKTDLLALLDAINTASAEAVMKGETEVMFGKDAGPAWCLKMPTNYDQPSMSTTLINLIAAAQGQTLTTEHMKGYFQAQNLKGISSGAIVKFINKLSAYFPEVAADKHYDKIAWKNKWQTYRTTRSSWQSALMKAAESLEEAGVVTPALVKVYMDIDTRLEENIQVCPEPLLFAIAACLKGAENYPSDWVQGDRALDNTPLQRKKAAITFWKKFFKFKAGTDEIEGAKDIRALLKLAGGAVGKVTIAPTAVSPK